MLACAIHDRRVAGAVARARHMQRLMLHAPQAEAAVLKFKEAALRTESCSSNPAAAASCAVVCCATNGYGRQPLAVAAVQTRHRDCCIIVAAGRLAVTMFHNANCLTSHRCTLCTSNRMLCGSHAFLCSRLRTHVVGARCRSQRRRRRCSSARAHARRFFVSRRTHHRRQSSADHRRQ